MKTGQINLGNYKAPLELGSTKAYVLFFKAYLDSCKISITPDMSCL